MAIIGAILGDIAGSKWEFDRARDYKNIELFTDGNFFTDDTVLTVATKYAIKNKISFSKAYDEFGNRYLNCGYGDRFFEWLKLKDKKPYNSYGNGSAMRVSPVVDMVNDYFEKAYCNQRDVAIAAAHTASCTHNHPEGIKGAVVTAIVDLMAKSGASKKEIEEYATEQYDKHLYRYPVSMSLKEMQATCVWSSTCQDSVPIAIRCFLDSEDYESFLRNVLSLNCDADTVAAIGGGLAEEFYRKTGLDDKTLLKKYLPKELYEIVFS